MARLDKFEEVTKAFSRVSEYATDGLLSKDKSQWEERAEALRQDTQLVMAFIADAKLKGLPAVKELRAIHHDNLVEMRESAEAKLAEIERVLNGTSAAE